MYFTTTTVDTGTRDFIDFITYCAFSEVGREWRPVRRCQQAACQSSLSHYRTSRNGRLTRRLHVNPVLCLWSMRLGSTRRMRQRAWRTSVPSKLSCIQTSFPPISQAASGSSSWSTTEWVLGLDIPQSCSPPHFWWPYQRSASSSQLSTHPGDGARGHHTP